MPLRRVLCSIITFYVSRTIQAIGPSVALIILITREDVPYRPCFRVSGTKSVSSVYLGSLQGCEVAARGSERLSSEFSAWLYGVLQLSFDHLRRRAPSRVSEVINRNIDFLTTGVFRIIKHVPKRLMKRAILYTILGICFSKFAIV